MIAALDSRRIAAGGVAPPQDIQLELMGKGYHRLLSLGDYVPGINAGLGVAA